jgi:hypothetical protein
LDFCRDDYILSAGLRLFQDSLLTSSLPNVQDRMTANQVLNKVFKEYLKKQKKKVA